MAQAKSDGEQTNTLSADERSRFQGNDLQTKVSRENRNHFFYFLTTLPGLSRGVITNAVRRIEGLKHEQPLRLLVSVGGASVLLGVFARVWRSNRHA
jgi:hypothetical protein